VKYILAISGGVDSVTLLDMVVKGKLFLQGRTLQKDNIIVAHFDHGIRAESGRDAELVKSLAERYQMKFVLGEGKLGKNASEQLARAKRYEFLRNLCKNGAYKIVTAHHQDDLLETVVMNLIRGTGWRGLAPFWSDDILRPLLGLTKAEIVNYAIENGLEWVEDETNYSAKYFRNRVRDFIVHLPAKQRKKLLELTEEQTKLRSEIEQILDNYCKNGAYKKVDEILRLPIEVTLEILRQITEGRLTTPQLKRLIKNLENAKSGDLFQPGGSLQVGVYRGELTISKIR
jgi:tRNA(Ile)-lysidine synthase